MDVDPDKFGPPTGIGGGGMALCGCGVKVLVIPQALQSAIPEDAWEPMKEKVGEFKTEEGMRIAVAEADGSFTCPACGKPGFAPPFSAN